MLLLLAACAQQGDSTAGPGYAPDRRQEAFDQRAIEVAEAWQEQAVSQKDWQSGYVPLQAPTVLTADPGFDADTRQAFLAGWYRHEVSLPSSNPKDGTIRFPSSTLTVPLISAAEAYRQLDQGDPPPCVKRPAKPPATTGPADPDDTANSGANTACVPLTVTDVKLGDVALRTSRGEARVPAWLFTIEELKAPVARAAVDESAVDEMPEVSAPDPQPGGDLVAAQDITAVKTDTLSYRLGVGACDQDIVPLVKEWDDVVVVGGGVTKTTDGACTDQLLMKSVSVTLDEPLGSRPVLDAVTGQPLILVPIG